MNYLHYEVKAGPQNVIRVTISREANVQLLDVLNFAKYRLGKSYSATLGPESTGPVQFKPPYKGVWHVVIDMEGHTGTVRALVDVLES